MMGRNAASDIIWGHAHNGTNHSFVWYCQQHTIWSTVSNATLATAFAALKSHLENTHGAIEQ